MLKNYFFLVGLRLNIASILSVTKKPPTTLKSANPRDIDPIIKSGLHGSDLIIAVNAANIVIPEIAFAPLIKGV